MASPLTIVLSWAFVLLCNATLSSQSVTDLHISFPKELDLNKVTIEFNDGRQSQSINVSSYELDIKKSFYSEYASIHLSYPKIGKTNDSHYYIFFLHDATAKLQFCYKDPVNAPMKSCNLVNVVEEYQMGGKQLEAFVSQEQRELDQFLEKHEDNLAVDSLFNLLIEKSTNLLKKKLQFIRANPTLYYSFWLYRIEVAGTRRIDQATKLDVFNAFPEKRKQSPEGNEILRLLYGSALKSGMKAPAFEATDLDQTKISLDEFQGKYLLLDFWASWCGPCIEEMPVIRRINGLGSDRIAIVSVSLDKSPEAFRKSVKKNGMTWRHILNDPILINLYGSYAVPSVFLIDPTGVVIYSREEEADIGLKKLEKVIDSQVLKKE